MYFFKCVTAKKDSFSFPNIAIKYKIFFIIFVVKSMPSITCNKMQPLLTNNPFYMVLGSHQSVKGEFNLLSKTIKLHSWPLILVNLKSDLFLEEFILSCQIMLFYGLFLLLNPEEDCSIIFSFLLYRQK